VPATAIRESVPGSVPMHLRTTWRARETCVPDFALLETTTTVRCSADGTTTTGFSVPMIAIDPLEWPGMNQAFLTALVATLVLSLAIIPYGKRRPVGTPFSWGEAMLGSTYLFGVLFLAFGILPHQFIDHADKDLGWSKDKIIFGPFDILKPESAGGWNPITLQYEAVRDIVVVLLHAVLFAMYVYLAVWWQKRGEVKPKELPTSTYGRPLVRKA